MTDCAVPDGASSDIVQLEAFEGSKENIQPSRTGYNPQKLLQSLTTQSSPTSDTILATQRHTLEQAILSYTGADPLLPWLQYVDWTVSSYPALSPCSSLLPLLEKATRTFLTAPQYANDRRYVRLWLLYADRCPHPADIFAFMHSRALGRTQSVFYVAWARYHELMKRYQQAEDALQLGVTCSAQPRNTLEIALKQLKARNEVRVRREVELMAAQQLDPLSDVVLNAMSDTQPRRVLSQLQQQDKENVSSQQPQSASAQPITSYRRPISAAPHMAAIRPVSTTQAPIQIYTDATTPSTSNSPPQPNLAPTAPATSSWRTLPTQAAVDKENSPAPTTWNQPLLTLRPSTTTTTTTTTAAQQQQQSSAQVRYAVWADEECERAEREAEGRAEERQRAGKERAERVAEMRRRMEAGGAAQATPHSKLTQDPLRNINKLAVPTPPVETMAGAPAPTSEVKQPVAPSRGRDSRHALSGLTVSLNATARQAPTAAGASTLNARLQTHRSMVAHRLMVVPRR